MRYAKVLFALSCFCLIYITGCAPPGDTKEVEPAVVQDKCMIYADMALSQSKEAIKYKCDYHGLEWGRDFAQHYAWCMREDNYRLAGEQLITRGGDILECRGKAKQIELSPVAGKCKAYAKMAVTEAREASKLKCGYKGSMWSGNYASQYEWCMQGDNHSKYAASRAILRNRDLQQCRIRGGGPAVPANSCAVYQQNGFQGRSRTIRDGESVEALDTDGWDDVISSVRLAKGCHLDAWKQAKFNGSKLVLLKSYDNVGSQWDNQISSLKCTCGH